MHVSFIEIAALFLAPAIMHIIFVVAAPILLVIFSLTVYPNNTFSNDLYGLLKPNK